MRTKQELLFLGEYEKLETMLQALSLLLIEQEKIRNQKMVEISMQRSKVGMLGSMLRQQDSEPQ